MLGKPEEAKPISMVRLGQLTSGTSSQLAAYIPHTNVHCIKTKNREHGAPLRWKKGDYNNEISVLQSQQNKKP